MSPTEVSSVDAAALSETRSERYRAVRARTEALVAALSAEDQQAQSMADASPAKWHRAHTTWFFETFVLNGWPGYEPLNDQYGFLFNSYYDAVGDRHPRAERGLQTRPDVEAITRYRQVVDATLVEMLATPDPDSARRAQAEQRIELGLHHEQQHQELLLMDFLHLLSRCGFDPAYRHGSLPSSAPTAPLDWFDHPGGLVDIGTDPSAQNHRGELASAQNHRGELASARNHRGELASAQNHRGELASAQNHFAFDNETPRHTVFLNPFRIADRLVTSGEWKAFMADDGYGRVDLWLSDGWHRAQSEGWRAPLYWEHDGREWTTLTLDGQRAVLDDEPVVHISHYEADAYARWADARLPTEFEWECVARTVAIDDEYVNLLDDPATSPLHPRAARTGPGLKQFFGDVWEWTASAYLPYPRFVPAPGAIGEYNGKFMSNQMVLRGGACVTPRGHARATYRNFYYPHQRWMFSGVRLAADS